MASDDELRPTQTQSQPSEVDMNGSIPENDKLAWGRLIARRYGIEDYDLISSTFTAGRLSTHSCSFTKEMPSKVLLQLSKTHFKLTKDLSDDYNPVYIEDCSRNGTYVNGVKIGPQIKRILRHNDVIAVVIPAYKVFTFRNAYRHSNELPDEIQSKYHIVRVLGAGACGTVYEVHDYISCQKRALKRITKHQINAYKKDKAKDEAEIMKAIKHPCVVKMYDVEDLGDSVYITLELMEGGELLSRILRNTHLDENISKLFFYQMCHAIKHLHDRKITHRDLKPDNILLASSETETLVKISDFGLSKLCPNNSVLTTMCGTPHYVAPEVLETLAHGKPKYDKKCDVWSLGVVLYTCLSGTLPFSNDYGSPAAEQIKKGEFRFRSRVWDRVSSMAKRLIREMLTVDAALRPSIDQLLKHEWLDDYNMKCKAHKIMDISPPPPPHDANIFAVPGSAPCRIEEIRPSNDENAQPMKKRRIH